MSDDDAPVTQGSEMEPFTTFEMDTNWPSLEDGVLMYFGSAATARADTDFAALDAGGRTADISKTQMVDNRLRDFVLVTAVAAVLMAVLVGISWRMVPPHAKVPARPPPEEIIFVEDKILPITSQPEMLPRYVEGLREAFRELHQAWESASEIVRQGFTAEFMPRDENGAPCRDPISFLGRHVAAVFSVAYPELEVVETERFNFAVNTRLVTAIVKATASRLRFLTTMELYCTYTGIGSELLHIDKDVLPSAAQLSNEMGVTFEEFRDMLYNGPVIVTEDDRIDEHKMVPLTLAHRLGNALKANSMLEKNDREVHGIFYTFLYELDDDLFPLKDMDGNRFPVGVFVENLSKFRSLSDRYPTFNRVIVPWHTEWTLEGCERIIERLEEEGHARYEDRKNAKERMQSSSLFALANSLL